MINLETPKKFKPLASQAHQVATEVFRPISRKYDEAEHAYPKELDMLASLIDGMNEGSEHGASGAAGVRRESSDDDGENRNGSNLSTVLGIIELCWGDVGLLLSMPRQGLGNSAIASVATEEQLEHYGGKWAAMAITEPEAGSDSAAIRTTAELDGDEYVLNGEKIFVTSGDRADLIVVWASLDRSKGPGGDQVVHRRARQPRPEAGPARAQARDPRLGHRQLHPAGLPGAERRAARRPGGRREKGFAGVMETFDNTRPLVAGDGLGVTRAALEETRRRLAEAGVEIDYRPPGALPARRRGPLPGDGGRLRGVAAADPARRLDGRQQQAELAAGLDGEGEGGAHLRRRHARLRRALRHASATARTSCSRSGPATPRSSTSSRAPSRSSC